MQPLEVTAAVGSVHKLQCAIEEVTHVPIAEQVLLASGGDGLQPDRSVAHYQGTGTDSNPVFLFCKLSKDDNPESSCPQENAELTEMSTALFDQLHRLENVSVSGALIGRYSETGRTSRQIADVAVQLCARLVQDHQLLYQGWLALVSNLDDSRAQIEKRVERFHQHYERLKAMKAKAQLILQDFDSVLVTLQKISVPSSLLACSSKFEGGNKPTGECSLYDYISCADPQSSLKDMVEQVQQLLSKIDNTEHKQVTNQLLLVNEQINKKELRDIGGINKRLTQLDSHLFGLEQQEKRLKEIASMVCQSGTVDPSRIKEVVFKQRDQMEEIKKIVEQLQKTARAFSQSKAELLNNIRTRLSGWILQASERLHSVNNLIIIFEEKFIALRNRLDIIRQVKESPVVYVTAITEAIRRNALQPEFKAWLAEFVEKSSNLVNEEATIRDAFTSKLDRHFLKQLFLGMFDQFPDFTPTGLPPFDQNLPPVDSSHLRALRQAVPHLAHLLKVSEPLIYQRLAVRDPRAASTITGNPSMRREESFFTSDAAINVAALSRNFPSTNWLSGDENLDIPPSSAPLMTKSPPSRFSSSMSLDAADASSKPLNPLPPLFDSSHQEIELSADVRLCQSIKSAPIKIPQRTESNRQVSEKSSQFSTPEDHFGSSHDRQFEMDRRLSHITSSGAAARVQTMLGAVDQLKKGLNSIKDVLAESKNAFGSSFLEASEFVNKFAVSFRESNEGFLRTAVDAAREEAIRECSAKYEESHKELKAKVDEGIARDRELEDLKEMIEEHQAEIAFLRAERTRLEAEKDDLFRKITIDHELEVDRLTSQHHDEIQLKDKEIDSLKTSLRKAKEVRSSAPSSEEKTEDSAQKSEEIRAAFEKEYKNKMQFLMKGLEEKKADEIARIKKEAEVDLRLKSKNYEQKIRELEERLRKQRALAPPHDDEKKADGGNRDESSIKAEEATDKKTSLVESVMVLGDAGPDSSRCVEEEARQLKDQKREDSEEDISAVTVNTAVTQTRIRLKDMRVMITIQEIHEGCAVLVVWSEAHSSYILFSTSPFMHFVKESCLRRMGVTLDDQTNRPNWLLAVTSRLELCQIRKADNRYNLATGTRFYRVEVGPLSTDSSGIRRRRSDD